MSELTEIKSTKLEIPAVLPVDKDFTRTYYQEDSLLSNLRRALPKQIPVAIFEDSVASAVSEEEFHFSNFPILRNISY